MCIERKDNQISGPVRGLWTVFSTPMILLIFGITLVSSAFGQTEAPFNGKVVTEDNRPIAGVTVYEDVEDPSQRVKATTDENGDFILAHPGAVIHLWKANLEQLAFVVRPSSSQVRIMMHIAQNDLVVPTCSRPEPKQRQLGWVGLNFTVPQKVKISGGKSQTDYVAYIIKPKKDGAYLELWFGPYAFNSEPDDEQFVESVNFSQRYLVFPDGGAIGEDSWGQLKNGLSWRHTGALGSGAHYGNANEEEAHLFDQIINSVCVTPSPTK